MNCVIKEFHAASVKRTRGFHKANSFLDQDELNEYCAEHFARKIIERCVELCNKGDDITDYFGLNLYVDGKPKELSPRKSEQVSKLTHALSLINEVLYNCDSKYANDLENLTKDLEHISDSIESDVLKNIFY